MHIYSTHLAFLIFSFFFFRFSSLKFTTITMAIFENLCLEKRKNKSAKLSKNLNMSSIYKILTSFFILFFCNLSFSQKSEKFISPNAEFERGLDLYNKEVYLAAYDSFDRTAQDPQTDENIKENCDYYLAITSVKLNKRGAEEILINFTKKYPTSIHINEGYMEAGNYFYNHGKPAASLKWFQKASPKYITSDEEESYNFKMGYALFSNEKYTEAKQYFLPLTHSNNYLDEANYYYGYISYLQEDYTSAQQYFNKLEGNSRYRKEILYYTMNIEFQNKNFKKVITTGNELLKIARKKEVSEISKIMGESYFYLENYDEAISSLKKYKGRKNRLSVEDHYFLGYSYYQIKEYKKAIVTFNRIIKANNAVAQNAHYHLAACYLELDKKSEALNAFKNSSELNFNEEIKEDAAYNYAKLSYEIGNPYKSSAEVLQEYVINYTTSLNAKEINSLVIDTYESSRDFEGALGYYKKRDLSKDRDYYEISMSRGMQLFQYSRFKDALVYFKIASSQIIAVGIQAKSMYWRAETSYRLNDYKAALSSFNRFQKLKSAPKTSEFKDIYYSLGYTYFKLKEYSKSSTNFTAYLKIKDNDPIKRNDSYIRLGDCYFISKSYWEAMEAYNKVIEKRGIDADYAQYQKAISYGFVRRNDRKIETLEPFVKQHPKSSYKDDALYELGNAYLSAKQNSKAITTYDKLINNYSRSLYVPKALLKQGLIYFNDDNPEKSVEKYKFVVNKYPNSKEAQQAVKNARQVYVDIDRVDEYADWIRAINYTKFTDIDLDNAMYEAAEIKYLDNNLTQAVLSFKKYLIHFPEGLHSLKANFYSAQANFSLENKEKALPSYKFVIAQSSNEYTEQSLARLTQIYLEKDAWDKAIPVLKRLEDEANFPQNILFAQSNLMKGMYEQEKYPETVIYAEKVLANKKADVQIKSDASIFIARSAIKTDDLKRAEKAYADVSKQAKGALKAEALYYEAYFQNIASNYKASNKTIQTLASKYANHKYWGVKGLIVMAKNNEGLNDVFQATYILENVIKNYSQFENLVEEAKITLKRIQEKEETKTKASTGTTENKKTETMAF